MSPVKFQGHIFEAQVKRFDFLSHTNVHFSSNQKWNIVNEATSTSKRSYKKTLLRLKGHWLGFRAFIRDKRVKFAKGKNRHARLRALGTKLKEKSIARFHFLGRCEEMGITSLHVPDMDSPVAKLTVAYLATKLVEPIRLREKTCNGYPRTLYDILELEPGCKLEHVRRAYYHFARIFHPDKCADGGNLELLDDIKDAYETLSDEYRRMLYDVEHGLCDPRNVDDVLISTLDHVKQRYYTFLQENAQYYSEYVTREFFSRGLVIKRAIYGNLRLVDHSKAEGTATIRDDDLKGPFIDVTIQLSLLVQGGILLVDSCRCFGNLPGFYNPLDFVSLMDFIDKVGGHTKSSSIVYPLSL
ncbi:bifunctional DnaJ-like protein C11 [Babesia duncani]|uniref:Bifunctional DnaJ-like protein C11 n=1 Tax=Babesia duncani TaxID=323732 RepID=A0AAD9PIK4_9APIC|nr:bifunctional DnaJ-like protein C11 [Babesia duncani]